MASKIDVQKFLTDPSHAEEREFLRGVFEAFETEKKKKQEEENKNKPSDKSFLQKLFDAE